MLRRKTLRDMSEYVKRCYASFAKESGYILTITKLPVLKLTRKVSPVVRNHKCFSTNVLLFNIEHESNVLATRKNPNDFGIPCLEKFLIQNERRFEIFDPSNYTGED